MDSDRGLTLAVTVTGGTRPGRRPPEAEPGGTAAEQNRGPPQAPESRAGAPAQRIQVRSCAVDSEASPPAVTATILPRRRPPLPAQANECRSPEHCIEIPSRRGPGSGERVGQTIAIRRRRRRRRRRVGPGTTQTPGPRPADRWHPRLRTDSGSLPANLNATSAIRVGGPAGSPAVRVLRRVEAAATGDAASALYRGVARARQLQIHRLGSDLCGPRGERCRKKKREGEREIVRRRPAGKGRCRRWAPSRGPRPRPWRRPNRYQHARLGRPLLH